MFSGYQHLVALSSEHSKKGRLVFVLDPDTAETLQLTGARPYQPSLVSFCNLDTLQAKLVGSWARLLGPRFS